MAEEKEVQQIQEPKSVTIKYPIMQTNFDSAEEVIAILKNNPEQSWKDWVEFFEVFLGDRKEEFKGVFEFTEDQFFNEMIQDWEAPYNKWIPKWTREEFWNKINSVQAITASEIFVKYHENAEQMMRALSFIDPEEIVKTTQAELINEETLTKTQKRTFVKDQNALFNANAKLNDDMFDVQEVTYEDNYKLYRIPSAQLKLEEDAYVVGCNCTSTGRKYFLFVEAEYAKTAVDAIASTMRDDKGNRMTREQYLEIESES